MHRLPSESSVTRYRFGSFLFILVYLLGISSLVLLAYAVHGDSKQMMIIALILLGVTLLTKFMQWLVSARARCPLCLVPSLLRKRCSKNRKAKRLFGSYRLRVAASIMSKGFFCCPYCGESTEIKVRQRARNSNSAQKPQGKLDWNE